MILLVGGGFLGEGGRRSRPNDCEIEIKQKGFNIQYMLEYHIVEKFGGLTD